MGSIVDVENFEGHFKVMRGHPRSNEVKWGKHWFMDLKLGGWGRLLMPKILKVTSRSSGVIQGQMGKHWCMESHGPSKDSCSGHWIKGHQIIQGQMGKH